MTPVTDPAVLAQLNGSSASAASLGLKPVTDPAVLQELNRQPTWGETALDIGRQAIGGINKGLASVATAPFRALDYVSRQAAERSRQEGETGIPGGPEGTLRDYLPRALFEGGYLDQPEAQTASGRFAAAAGEAVGASAYPSAGFLQLAGRLPAVARTAVPSVGGAATTYEGAAATRVPLPQAAPARGGAGEAFLRPIAEAPGTAVGLDALAATGSGVAQQAAHEADAGPLGENLAAMAGGFVSPVAAIAVPAAGRTAFNTLPRLMMSADGGLAGTQAKDAALQLIADQMRRANVTVDDLYERLATGEWARKFHTSGKAQDAMVLADLDESLARLAGSAVRQQPEAANLVREFIQARQTGLTPDQPLHEGAGIPTRQAMDKDAPLAGQHDRMMDGLRRALRVRDEDYHGHGANATRTDQQIAEQARADAKPAYDDLYATGRGVNLRPALKPVLLEWADRRNAAGNELATAITRAMRGFFTIKDKQLLGDIENFDKAKQFLDGKIENLFKSSAGRNRYLGMVLTDLKNDLVAAVDGVLPQYKDARAKFSSHMESRDAIRAGREAYRDDTDVGVDAFRALPSREMKNLFKLGYLGEVEKASAALPDSADRARLFASRKQQDILANIIERTETPTGRVKIAGGEPAEFSDRPQRFAGLVGDEALQARTRNIVKGGSPTAERLADDAAFDTLHTILEVFKDPRLVSIGRRAAEYAINKAFGLRVDTATEVTRMLFSASPGERVRILESLRQIGGKTRFERFNELMTEQYRRSAVGTGGGVASGGSPEGGQESPPGMMRLGGSPVDEAAPEQPGQFTVDQSAPTADEQAQMAADEAQPRNQLMTTRRQPELRSYQPTPEDWLRSVLTYIGMPPEQAGRAAAVVPYTPPGTAYDGGRKIGRGVQEGDPGEVAGGVATTGLAAVPAWISRGVGVGARALNSLLGRVPKTSAAGLAVTGTAASTTEAGKEEPSEEVMTLQQKLKNAGYYKGPIDGLMGGQTEKAKERFEADEQRKGEQAIERARIEAEKAKGTAAEKAAEAKLQEEKRRQEEARIEAEQRAEGERRFQEAEKNVGRVSRAIRDYSTPLGVAAGIVGGTLGRKAATKFADRASAREATRANALIDPSADLSTRVGNVNQFYAEGQRIPFHRRLMGEEPENAFLMTGDRARRRATLNPDIPSSSSLYLQPPRIGGEVGLDDLGVMAGWGSESAYAQLYMLPKAEAELETARAAMKQDKTEESIQRYQTAIDNVAIAKGLANVGRVGAGFHGLSSMKVRRSPSRPDVGRAEGEVLNLRNELMAAPARRATAPRPSNALMPPRDPATGRFVRREPEQ